jgi:Polysaccharide deacetylase/Chitin recognition protein
MQKDCYHLISLGWRKRLLFITSPQLGSAVNGKYKFLRNVKTLPAFSAMEFCSPLSVVKLCLLLGLLWTPFLVRAQRCGQQGNGRRCPDSSPCCSEYGYCGSTAAYCDPDTKCQLGCWPKAKSGKNLPFNPSTGSDSASSQTDQDAPDNHFETVDTTLVDSAPFYSPIQEEFMKSENPHFDSRGLFSSCAVKNVVSMSYDDGPSVYTNGILDALKRVNVTATFFVIGSNINSNEARQTVKRIHDEGHILASHTWSHPDLTTLTSSQIRDEMDKTADLIHEITGRAYAHTHVASHA